MDSARLPGKLGPDELHPREDQSINAQSLQPEHTLDKLHRDPPIAQAKQPAPLLARVSTWAIAVIGLGGSLATLYQMRPILNASAFVTPNPRAPFPLNFSILNAGHLPVGNLEVAWLTHKVVFNVGGTVIWTEHPSKYLPMATKLPPGDMATISPGPNVRLFLSEMLWILSIGELGSGTETYVIRPRKPKPSDRPEFLQGEAGRSRLAGSVEQHIGFVDARAYVRYSPWLISLRKNEEYRFMSFPGANGDFSWMLSTPSEPDRVNPTSDVFEISDTPFAPLQ